jgi:predicted nucleotidyltransferase
VTRDSVLQVLRLHWAELQSQFGVRSLSIYGSVARNEARSSSDVDLLVEFDRPAGYFDLERLHIFLEGILGCSVDVNTFPSLRATIREQVAREAVRVN